MIKIKVPDLELWNEATQEYEDKPGCTIKLEHSLVALRKWESKWHLPFLELGQPGRPQMTQEMFLDYVECMSLKPVDRETLNQMGTKETDTIVAYMNTIASATTVKETKAPTGKKQVWTAELFYYCIFANQIDISVERWHLSQLSNLLKVFEIKNAEADPKHKKRAGKLNADEYAERQALNEQRRNQYKTKG